MIDPAGRYAYLGNDASPGRVIKVDLSTFSRVDTLALPAGEWGLSAAVIDPMGASPISARRRRRLGSSKST